MKDLNTFMGSSTGWDNLEYWMASVVFWTSRIEEFGDVNGYGKSLDMCWSMVNVEIFGEIT